jgi:hypothetical protein
MDKVEFIEVEDRDGNKVTTALIDHGNGEFTSMLKSTYDAQQAEAKAPKVIDEAAPL